MRPIWCACCLGRVKEGNLKPKQRGKEEAVPTDPGSTHTQISPISKLCAGHGVGGWGPVRLKWPTLGSWFKVLIWCHYTHTFSSYPATDNTHSWTRSKGHFLNKLYKGTPRFGDKNRRAWWRQSGCVGPGQLRGAGFPGNRRISPKPAEQWEVFQKGV